MVHCIEVREMAVPVQQCKSYEQLLCSAAEKCGKSVFSLKLFFVNANNQATLIESDSDLLSIRYITRGNTYNFRVEISKSKAEIELEEERAIIGDYLEATYEEIAEQALQKELKQISSDYLQELYGQIARIEEEQSILRMEKEEVKKCIARINEKAIQNHLSRKVSPPLSKSLRKESIVEKMVEKALRQMMPMMVKQLSSRILDELRHSKFDDSNRDAEENPEQL